MHEHIRNLSPTWVAFGWFMAVALASLILLALDALGVIGAESSGESVWVAVAFLVSFLLAGFFVGTRVAAAPMLNGIAMGLFSVVVWLLINLLVGEPIGVTTWRSLPGGSLMGLLGLQMAAAVVGARVAVRWMRST